RQQRETLIDGGGKRGHVRSAIQGGFEKYPLLPATEKEREVVRSSARGRARDQRGKRGYFAAATARFAITVTRCARYSALAWMSELSPFGETLTLATASGANDLPSADSISFWRKTEGPAPVTATRTPPAVLATKTPTIA